MRNRNYHAALTLPITATTNAGATFGPYLMRVFFLLMQHKMRTMMRRINSRSKIVRKSVTKTSVMSLISMVLKTMVFMMHITASVFKLMPVKMLSYCVGEEKGS